MDKNLQLILQSLNPTTPTSSQHTIPAITTGEKPPIIPTAPLSVQPVNLNTVFEQQVTKVTTQQHQAIPSAPLPTQPVRPPTVGFSAPPVFTDSTILSTTKQIPSSTTEQFRLSIPSSNIAPGLPAVQLHGQPPPMPNTGNTGYFAQVIAPQCIPPVFNHVTGQYISPATGPAQHPSVYQSGVNIYDAQRNQIATQLGGPSFYAEAVLKGPRLEIPLFEGDNPIDWLISCEKFFDMTGTPYDQWVNLATGHFQGRASVWLKNICVPWQMVTWQQFCQILSDRFTEATVHEAVEMLKMFSKHQLFQNILTDVSNV